MEFSKVFNKKKNVVSYVNYCSIEEVKYSNVKFYL